MDSFKHAITRLPGENLFKGLTNSGLGAPDLVKARQQHQRYHEALLGCGLELRVLPEDLDFPDSTFVEDTAILTPRCAVITRPGAASRQGEVNAIRPVLQEYFSELQAIQAPGTLDGGDVCDADGHFFIGVSERTNESGARQLADILAQYGYTADLIDIIHKPGLLHLKSGLAYLGDNLLVLTSILSDDPHFSAYEHLIVPEEESYAANCIRVNDTILIASGYPKFAEQVKSRGYNILPLDMSEFRKMDGGLSCLSLRF